jgi:WD40 repeat protein
MKRHPFCIYLLVTCVGLASRPLSAQEAKEPITLKGHTISVHSVAFSPDGKQIVSGSFDKTIKLWDAVTGKEILTFKGHTDPVFSVAFSPDGKRIVSGSHDGTVKVWEMPTGK